MVIERKHTSEFLDSLLWFMDDIYADRDHVCLFLDNCSIHHTRAIREYIEDHHDKVTLVWNTTYAANYNLIARFGGLLKRSVIYNYYLENVENPEKAITKTVKMLNHQKNHPL